MSCKNVLSRQDAVEVGIMLAKAMTFHENDAHEERPCWWGRVELAAFVAHCLGLRPEDMAKVAGRITAHEAGCMCPARPRPPAGW